MVPAQNYVGISRRPPDVEDYIDMLRRYRSWIIGPTFAGLVIATVVAFFWPDTYISTAVMRITPQQVPDSLVPSTITSQMADRLQQMETEILSRTSLAEIIQKPSLDLYKKERTRVPMEDIVQDMRNKSIRITPLTDVPTTGGRHLASAFAISFMYTDRYKAQAVVRELVTKFMEQNYTVQRNQANLTTNFLSDEVKAAKEKMDNLDGQITKFRVQNMGELPEQASANAQSLQTYQLQLMNVESSLNRATQDRIILETNLTNVKTSANNAMVNLEQTVGGTPNGGGAPQMVQNQKLIDLNRTISDLRSKLEGMKQSLGAHHPDVAQAEAALDSYERERDALEKQESLQASQAASAAAAVANSTTPVRLVQNPVVARQLEQYRSEQTSLQTQIAAKQMEIDNLKQSQEQLQKVITQYNKRLQNAPLNEQQYNALLRDYNLAKDDYEAMTKRHEQAETAQNIEEHKAGENLEVLDPASLPEQPAEPNRLAWAGIGTFAGLGLGIMLAAAQEVKNTSLKNLKDVRAYTNMPVLSSIPLLENALLVRRKRRLVWLAWSSAIILGSLLMGGSMYYHISGV
jgi:polysaccharide chain length determinant protein (PEP-CTERM system associated)